MACRYQWRLLTHEQFINTIPQVAPCSAASSWWSRAGAVRVEPFVGGGSVFLNSEKHADYLLADVNPDLINLYQMLAVVPDEVELKARWMFEHMRSPERYELIRSEFNSQTLDAT
ncbi:DNA adenine methylase, partial [Escherichia coli]